jgi:SAM-dependent methyltransferase
MAFEVGADAYQRFMGRFADPLAAQTLDLVGAQHGQRAVDVGAGTGALTAPLVDRLSVDAVVAVDPSPAFVAALHARLPEVDVHLGAAEALPFADDAVDLALAQLVVHFMTDPVLGLREMLRVTRPGGLVAVSVWDFAGGRSPLSLFWRAAADLDPGVDDESGRAGAREGDLAELLRAAGGRDVEAGERVVSSPHRSPADWWEPYTLGVGPAGEYLAGLPAEHRDALRARALELLVERYGSGPGAIDAVAWVATARA